MSSDGHIRRSRLAPKPRPLEKIPPPGPIPDVVAVCETLLARARSGEIRGVGVAAVALHGEVTTAFVGGDDLRSLLLAVHLLDDRILGHYR